MCGVSTKNKPLFEVYSRHLSNTFEKCLLKKWQQLNITSIIAICVERICSEIAISLPVTVRVARNLIFVKMSEVPSVEEGRPTVLQCKICTSALGGVFWRDCFQTESYMFINKSDLKWDAID